MIKAIAFFSVAAWLILVASSVWFGSLNQDEGWYLYAANMIGEGYMPYLDFAFTQGPVMPYVYSAVSAIWKNYGLLGARLFTCSLALLATIMFAATAALLAKRKCAAFAFLSVFILLANNVFHVYYTAIPKTYALTALFLSVASFAFVKAMLRGGTARHLYIALSASAFAFAAATRISFAVLLPIIALSLLAVGKKNRLSVFFVFCGVVALVLGFVYFPFLIDDGAREGLLESIAYHSQRGDGLDFMNVVGSLSRLSRAYLPLFVFAGAAICRNLFCRDKRGDASAADNAGYPLLVVFTVSFAALFAVHLFSPFPYEDYQTPVMCLAAVVVAVAVSHLFEPRYIAIVLLGVVWISSFSSPLIESWFVAGHDRFWPVMKKCSDIDLLRSTAREIEQLDPGGKELLTQDLYLAIETNRRVPRGLEMGPFSTLTLEQFCALISRSTAPVAALSGYSFAIEPPKCNERDKEEQQMLWEIVDSNYQHAKDVPGFGQHSTLLRIYQRKQSE